MHLVVHEWYGKQLRQRYIAVKVRFIDAEFEMVSVVLSIRHFDRSMASDELTRASEGLLDWVKGVLKEYNIDISQVYSATTDAGSDVRYMCETLMGVEWEWCIPHLLTNAIKESCGMMRSQANMTETFVRYIIDSISEVITKITASKVTVAAFYRLVILKFGKRLALKRNIGIRFTGVVTTMERTLKVWTCLQDFYAKYFREEFLLHDQYHTIEQLMALFNKVKEIRKQAKFTSHPASCTTLLKLFKFYAGELRSGANLAVSPTNIVQKSSIAPLVEATRSKLRAAIEKRFFNRYMPLRDLYAGRGAGKPSQSLLLEMAMVMHPTYKKLSCFNKVISIFIKDNCELKAEDLLLEVKEKVHEKVMALANRAYLAVNNLQDQRRSILNFSMEECLEIDSMADAFSVASVGDFTIYDTVVHTF